MQRLPEKYRVTRGLSSIFDQKYFSKVLSLNRLRILQSKRPKSPNIRGSADFR